MATMEPRTRWKKAVKHVKSLRVPKRKPKPNPTTVATTATPGLSISTATTVAQFIELLLNEAEDNALRRVKAYDRNSNGGVDENARLELHRGLEHLEVDESTTDIEAVPRQPTTEIQQESRLLSLPVEILQQIAWEYCSWSAEAALAFTCHQMQDIIGTRSWKFHDSNHPPCLECDMFDKNGRNDDIFGSFACSKERFLELLARDLPRGSAMVCLQHEVIHQAPELEIISGNSIPKALSVYCNVECRLPMGLSWGPRCADIQFATMGLLPAEQISHYQKCSVRKPSNRDLPSDVTVYGKVIEGRFILAMQYRFWIAACNHVPAFATDEVVGECVICYKECMENIHWMQSGHGGFLCLPMYSNKPADWHGKEFTVRQAHTSESKYIARTTVLVEYERGKGVMIFFDIFSDLGRGYRPTQVLGRSQSLVAAPAPLRICDCEPCKKRRTLEKIYLEHFKDHRERLDELRPARFWEEDAKNPRKSRRTKSVHGTTIKSLD